MFDYYLKGALTSDYLLGIRPFDAGVAELVDALDLGSSIARCGSSSLLTRTKIFCSEHDLHYDVLIKL